jgi:signal transduction histidine kinase
MGNLAPDNSLPPLNLLLVDDKPENLHVLEELLRQPDRKLFSVQSGNEALRLLLRYEFAVVLLDVEMPGMDGYETAELMRSVERTRVVPIIFVTAGDRTEERTFRGYAAGAIDFLYKPLNPYMLTCKVDAFVEMHRKSEALALANAQLERATAALRDKVTDLEHVNRTLSHDLRAPLRTIRGFSAALAESLDATANPEAADSLARIQRAGERMTVMLDDLFALLRVGAADDAVADVDLGEVLTIVEDNLRTDIAAAHATITRESLPPAMRTNRGLLLQVLQNLIANALKFRGEAAPAIHVSATRHPETWQISVRDNGIGISADDRERVFGLFERASSASSTTAGGAAHSGSGVGLALCKRAVEKLGGKIWIDAAVERGTRFCFTVRA